MTSSLDELGFQIGAAGLGIGAFSGVLDVLSACTRLYGLWRALRALDGHLGLLRAKLVLQCALLEQWERDWLSFPAGQAARRKRCWVRQNEAAIEAALGAVRRLLEGLEPLRVASSAKGPAAVLERLGWANGKAPESERALEHLESLLAGLYRLLPPRTPNTDASQVILSMEDLDQGASESEGQQISASSTFTKTIRLRSLGQQLNHDLGQRVDNFIHRPATAAANLSIKASRVQVKANDEATAGFRSFGTLDAGQPVVIEWKRYDASWVGKKSIELTGRIYNIAQLLGTDTKPDELLTLRCLGFFDDPERGSFGFVFRMPLTGSVVTDPWPKQPMMLSLKALLDEPSPAYLPTLEERYQTCYSLALSLSVLHTVSWLHKSVRSQNVLFPVLTDGRPVWSRPYLVGFDFSRPDAIDESSEKPEQSARFNVYRHPSAQGSPNEGYRRAFDIYSLGVLLLELALWRPAWKLYRDGMDPDRFRQVLLDKSTDWLAHFMGTEYRDAAVKCLNGHFDVESERVVQTFYIEVVEVLGRLQEATTL